MNTRIHKIKDEKRRGTANEVAQRPRNTTSIFQFADKRPEATAHRKLQDGINNSPQVKQLQRTQAMANKYLAQQPATIQKKVSVESIQKKNNTGLPDHLKSGIENLSGYSLDDVKVHYNSNRPAQLQAHAYAQGTDIHLGPGQEKHLPHEAWHVVQQKQGRVRPTLQMKGGGNVNDSPGLESEADVMGARAVQMKADPEDEQRDLIHQQNTSTVIVQRKVGDANAAAALTLFKKLDIFDQESQRRFFMRLMFYFHGDAMISYDFLEEVKSYTDGDPAKIAQKLQERTTPEIERYHSDLDREKENILAKLPPLFEELGLRSDDDKNWEKKLTSYLNESNDSLWIEIHQELDELYHGVDRPARQDEILDEIREELLLKDHLARNFIMGNRLNMRDHITGAEELFDELVVPANRELGLALFTQLIAEHGGDAQKAAQYVAQKFRVDNPTFYLNQLSPQVNELKNSRSLLETLVGLREMSLDLLSPLIHQIKAIFGEDLKMASLYLPLLAEIGTAQGIKQEMDEAAKVEEPSARLMFLHQALMNHLFRNPGFIDQINGIIRTGTIDFQSFSQQLIATSRTSGLQPTIILSKITPFLPVGRVRDYLGLIQLVFSAYSPDISIRLVLELINKNDNNPAHALHQFRSLILLFKNDTEGIAKIILNENPNSIREFFSTKTETSISEQENEDASMPFLLWITGGNYQQSRELSESLRVACDDQQGDVDRVLEKIKHLASSPDQAILLLNHVVQALQSSDLNRDIFIAQLEQKINAQLLIDFAIIVKHRFSIEWIRILPPDLQALISQSNQIEEFLVLLKDVSDNNLDVAGGILPAIRTAYNSDIPEMLHFLHLMDENEVQLPPDEIGSLIRAEKELKEHFTSVSSEMLSLVRPLLFLFKDNLSDLKVFLHQVFSFPIPPEEQYDFLEETIILTNSRQEVRGFFDLFQAGNHNLNRAKQQFKEQKRQPEPQEQPRAPVGPQQINESPERRKLAALYKISEVINDRRPTIAQLINDFPTIRDQHQLSDIHLYFDGEQLFLSFSASPPTLVKTTLLAGKQKIVPDTSKGEEISTTKAKEGWDSGYSKIVRDSPKTAYEIINGKFSQVNRARFKKPRGTYYRPDKVKAWKEGASDSKGRKDPSLVKNVGKLGDEERDLKTAEKAFQASQDVPNAIKTVQGFEYRGGHLVAYSFLGKDSNISSNVAPQGEKFNHPAYYTFFEQVGQKSSEKVTIKVTLHYRNATYNVSKDALQQGGYITAASNGPANVALPTRIPNKWEASVETVDKTKKLGATGGLGSFGDRLALNTVDFDQLTLTHSDVKGYAILIQAGAVKNKQGDLSGSGGKEQKIHIVAKQQDFE